MKKLQILLIAFVATISFNSCSDDEGFTFIAQEDPEGISFVNSTSANYVLRSTNSQGLGERFVWNAVDFDVPTTIRYELQGSGDQSFANYDVIGSDIAETNYAVTVGQMIDLAEEAGLDNDPSTEAPNTGTIYFRVMAYAGTNTNNNVVQTSTPLAVNVELFEAVEGEEPSLPNLFLVGSATATGWDNTPNSNNYPLYRDADNQNLFHYTGKFVGGEDMAFKLLEVKGLWAPQYGGENGTLVYRPTEADPDPAAIAVGSEGYYTLTVNIDEMTYTLTPFDASNVPVFSTIGIIGSATTGSDDTGWSEDIDMTQSTFDPHIWFIKGMELYEVDGGEGKIKFRADNSWDVNWGGPSSLSGQGTPGGADIEVPAGTYDIWFNDITKRYLLIPVE